VLVQERLQVAVEGRGDPQLALGLEGRGRALGEEPDELGGGERPVDRLARQVELGLVLVDEAQRDRAGGEAVVVQPRRRLSILAKGVTGL
jgi:hypothetical protein